MTRVHTPALVPDGGHHRPIDATLSNCLHSALADGWVSVQYNPVSTARGTCPTGGRGTSTATRGACWCRTRAGRRPGGWVTGTADGLCRDADLIRRQESQALVVLGADDRYRLDDDAVITEHRDSGRA